MVPVILSVATLSFPMTYLCVHINSRAKKNPMVKNPIACSHLRPTVSANNAVIITAEVRKKKLLNISKIENWGKL